MAPSSILAFVLAACVAAVSASPFEVVAQRSASSLPKIPFTARPGGGSSAGAINIVTADQARLAHIHAESKKDIQAEASALSHTTHSINATNAAVIYTANVTVNGTVRDLLIDTGSSNTWIGAKDKTYDTNTTACDGFFFVTYGSGLVLGYECTDTIELAPDLVIANQSFGAALLAIGFNTDGILGIGPAILDNGTTGANGSFPTVTDNLFAQGLIDTEAIGVFYAPPTSEFDVNGELTFGGADDSKYIGELAYTNLTTTAPANRYWGVDQTVSYGNTTIMGLSAGIVDTGTTLVYLPSDAFATYVNATGAVFDNTTGLYAVTEEQYAALEPLTFNIGTAGSYSLSPNAQIWPRARNADLRGNASAIYLIVGNNTVGGSAGPAFINGYTFLERFYTVFDTTNSRFGIAPTEFTNATTN